MTLDSENKRSRFITRLPGEAMIPLYSDHRRSAFPYMTVVLIMLNIAAFWHQLTMPGSVAKSVWMFGVVPVEIFKPGSVAIEGRLPGLMTLVTGMFMHGGFLHLGSNMLYLWVFGRDIEDDFGAVRFLVFYLVSGLVATVVFVLTFPGTTIPLVGASGAIAGLLGAYFLRFPLTRIYTLFFFFIFVRIIPIPAFIALGLWFFFQFLSCLAEVTAAAGAAGQGGIAWIAHIAGFITGVVWTLMILRRRFYEGREQPGEW